MAPGRSGWGRHSERVVLIATLLSAPQEDFMGGAEIRISDPVVSFRETIGDKADHVCMSKSPNKHNRCGPCIQSACPAQHLALLFLMAPSRSPLSVFPSVVLP
jgi:hypothetical protein